MNISSKRQASYPQDGNRWRPVLRMLLLFLFLYDIPDTQAQRLAVKTNVPEWAICSPNIGLEFVLSNRLSLECNAAFFPFRLKDNLYFKHARMQPELKYWFDNALSRHYVGVTTFYSSYDVGLKKKGYYGDSFAAGLTYGYNWILSRHWNLEIAAGIGAMYYRLKRYTPTQIHYGPNERGWTITPVKLGISFVYIIK